MAGAAPLLDLSAFLLSRYGPLMLQDTARGWQLQRRGRCKGGSKAGKGSGPGVGRSRRVGGGGGGGGEGGGRRGGRRGRGAAWTECGATHLAGKGEREGRVVTWRGGGGGRPPGECPFSCPDPFLRTSLSAAEKRALDGVGQEAGGGDAAAAKRARVDQPAQRGCRRRWIGLNGPHTQRFWEQRGCKGEAGCLRSCGSRRSHTRLQIFPCPPSLPLHPGRRRADHAARRVDGERPAGQAAGARHPGVGWRGQRRRRCHPADRRLAEERRQRQAGGGANAFLGTAGHCGAQGFTRLTCVPSSPAPAMQIGSLAGAAFAVSPASFPLC